MKRSKKQSKEIDFDSAVEAWEKKKISRDQLAEHLKELGFDDPEFIIKDIEWEQEWLKEEEEQERLSNNLKRARASGNNKKIVEAVIEILEKYGDEMGWLRPKE